LHDTSFKLKYVLGCIQNTLGTNKLMYSNMNIGYMYSLFDNLEPHSHLNPDRHHHSTQNHFMKKEKPVRNIAAQVQVMVPTNRPSVPCIQPQ
jgi:hypothetical protein